MFARNVTIHLKPNCVKEFTETIENQIIPLLRKQRGFQDEITLVAQSQLEATAISLWDQNDNAEAYNKGPYHEVLKALAKVVEGTPQVQTYEVSNSTLQKSAARAAG